MSLFGFLSFGLPWNALLMLTFCSIFVLVFLCNIRSLLLISLFYLPSCFLFVLFSLSSYFMLLFSCFFFLFCCGGGGGGEVGMWRGWGGGWGGGSFRVVLLPVFGGIFLAEHFRLNVINSCQRKIILHEYETAQSCFKEPLYKIVP